MPEALPAPIVAAIKGGMKYDALLAVIVAGCANFSVFLLRPSITSELPDLALAGLWFVAVFLLVYGLLRVVRRKRGT